jgi:hypothetical protein
MKPGAMVRGNASDASSIVGAALCRAGEGVAERICHANVPTAAPTIINIAANAIR